MSSFLYVPHEATGSHRRTIFIQFQKPSKKSPLFVHLFRKTQKCWLAKSFEISMSAQRRCREAPCGSPGQSIRQLFIFDKETHKGPPYITFIRLDIIIKTPHKSQLHHHHTTDNTPAPTFDKTPNPYTVSPCPPPTAKPHPETQPSPRYPDYP